jgi:glycosyltransferase involved in cell wall biosynthesis
MAVLLQIHDKAEGGGGIFRVVSDLAQGLGERGLEMRELRLAHRADTGAPLARLSRHAAPDDAALAAMRTAARGVDGVLLHLGFTALSPELIVAAARAAPLHVALHDVTPFCPNASRLTWPTGRLCDRPVGGGCYASLCAGTGQPLLTARRAFRWPARHAVWTALAAQAATILAPSRYLADLARRAGASPGKVVIAPPPVPLTAEDRACPLPSACAPVIVHAGLIAALKGTGLLIEAMAQLPADARLILLGDGPDAAALAARARALGLGDRVQFAGRVDREALARIVCEARVLAQPSLIPEGLGLAGIEALALGRPVVGFGRGGQGDWLRHGETGLVAPPTADGLAQALARLLADGALADRLGAAGQALVRATYAPAVALDRLAGVLTPRPDARAQP